MAPSPGRSRAGWLGEAVSTNRLACGDMQELHKERGGFTGFLHIISPPEER